MQSSQSLSARELEIMPRYILQATTADGLPMYNDGSFFTRVPGKALVFDDGDGEGRRSRAALQLMHGFTLEVRVADGLRAKGYRRVIASSN